MWIEMDSSKSVDNKNLKSVLDKEKFSIIGKLSGGLLHNLGTPLMGSSGQLILSDSKLEKLANMLDDDSVSKNEIKKTLLELKNHNNNLRIYLYYMSDVINSVKSYIKTSSHSKMQPIKIQNLFKKVQMLTSFEVKSHHIKIDFSMDPRVQNINLEGELSSLIQIIINLIDNSIHSYNGNKGIIDVNASTELIENKDYLKISVQDFGSGMDEDIKSKLLEQMVSTKGDEGTGIGLYLSNILLKDKFNGILKFESELNKGTIMYIYIPLG